MNCDTEYFYNKAPEAKISPLMSLTSEEPDARDEELQQDGLSTEDENKEEDEVDEDDDTEFEETLIEPRPLNEVTSATDRTSPWTTVLSEPEHGSLESIESTEQPVDLIHQKERKTVSPFVTTSKTQRTAFDSELLAGDESNDTAEDAEIHSGNLHNVCVELEDDVFFNKDSKQDTSQITDHDQQDSMTDSDVSNSPLSSVSEPGTMENSENEKIKSNVKLYPFYLQYCLRIFSFIQDSDRR